MKLGRRSSRMARRDVAISEFRRPAYRPRQGRGRRGGDGRAGRRPFAGFGREAAFEHGDDAVAVHLAEHADEDDFLPSIPVERIEGGDDSGLRLDVVRPMGIRHGGPPPSQPFGGDGGAGERGLPTPSPGRWRTRNGPWRGSRRAAASSGIPENFAGSSGRRSRQTKEVTPYSASSGTWSA